MGGAKCQWFDSDFGRFHEYTTPRVYLKTQNCTKRQEKDIKGFYHRQYKEVIA